MAKVGTVVSLKKGITPFVVRHGPIVVTNIGFAPTSAPTAPTRDMTLDATNQLIQVEDSSTGVEGRYVKKESYEQVTNAEVAAAAGIVGTKLQEGAGPLTHLSSAGALDNITSVTARSLDDITDGSTYKRVTGVTSGQVTATSIAASAVSAVHTKNNVRRVGMLANASFTHRRTV